MPSVYANKLSIIHAGDGQQFISMTPDVCKTPSPGGPVPIPYPNIAMSSDLADGSKTVKVEGNSAALESSNLKTSSGDEGGTAGGGIVSSKIKGKLTWVRYSSDVKFEGKGVVRFLDNNMHNGNGSNTTSIDKGDNYMQSPGEALCINCGKPFDEHEFPEITADPKLHEEGNKKFKKDKRAHMVGGLKADCGATVSQSIAKAGIMPGWLNAGGAIINFASGREIPLTTAQRDAMARGKDRNPVGNCVEQKTLDKEYHKALEQGKKFPGGCALSMGVGEKDGKEMRAPCETCKEIMMGMLCTNEPQEEG
jgi:hypothetical protein